MSVSPREESKSSFFIYEHYFRVWTSNKIKLNKESRTSFSTFILDALIEAKVWSIEGFTLFMFERVQWKIIPSNFTAK